MSDDVISRIQLPRDGESIDNWLKAYGREITADELNELIHYKNQVLPRNKFTVWCHVALMGSYSGWILKDVTSVRTLWHSLGKDREVGDWFYVDKTLAMPFTDAPVF